MQKLSTKSQSYGHEYDFELSVNVGYLWLWFNDKIMVFNMVMVRYLRL